MLTELEKAKTRRHLKFPVAGLLRTGVAGGTLAQGAVGYRFLQAYGFLEYKLNNITPVEEAMLTGKAYGAAALVGPQPNTGDSVSLIITPAGAATQTITAIAPGGQGTTDLRLTLCNGLVVAAVQNPVLQQQGFIGLTPYGTGPFSQNAVAVPEVSFSAPAPFTIAGSFTGSAGLAPQITAPGMFVDPSTSLDGVTTIWGFLPILDGLMNAYGTSSQNLDTIKADVWTGRGNEAGARRSLYEAWVAMLADFLGTEVYRYAKQRPKSGGAIRFA